MKQHKLYLIWLLLAYAGIAQATNTLRVGDVELAPGGSVTLSIELENDATNLMGWQCDIILPEGFSLALKTNGKPASSLGSRFSTTEHSISSSCLSNGAYRFIATSMDGEAIPEKSGTLFSVTLLADASITPGTKFTGSLTNIEFNTQDNQKLTFADLSFSISIPSIEKKCVTPTINYSKGKISFSCETEGVTFKSSYTYNSGTSDADEYILSGTTTCHVSVYATKEGYLDSDTAKMDIKMSVGPKGDVNQDGVVSITDAVTVVNIILQPEGRSVARELNNGEATAPAMESPAVEVLEVVEPE